MEKFDLLQLLPYISSDDYEVWYQVGLALKQEGYSVQDWDEWSRSSSKYHPGECERKWDSFNGSGVTGATITMWAKEGGWEPTRAPENEFLAWDAMIGSDKPKKIDEGFLEKEAIPEPKEWNPNEQLYNYLSTLFQPDDIVGFSVKARQDKEKDKWYPSDSGVYVLTAGQIMDNLKKYKSIEYVIGDYNKAAGAWIRINPLDGKGVANANVTDFRYTLVESDDVDLEKQLALIKKMELPVAALVHSGGKSIHAVVKVNAMSMDDYQKKVQYLYEKCSQFGFRIDTKNKNPSRLSRMPGIIRKGKKKFLIDTNIGKESWDEWVKFVETELGTDPLPDPIRVCDMALNPPILAPELIYGILREGHKMMITAASKSGKTHLAFMLALAIATGGTWLKWQCKKGRVLYIDGEMDDGDFWNRLNRLAIATGQDLKQIDNLDVYLCRGKMMKIEELAKQLVFKFQKNGPGYYSAIIIDPIYAFGMTDENSAEIVIQFLMNFDVIAAQMGTSVIYIHHHSKGSQDTKRAGDRGSGSGVFARHADALIDMIDLDVEPEVRKYLCNQLLCKELLDYFAQRGTVIDHAEMDNAEMIARYAKDYVEKCEVQQLKNKVESVVETFGGRQIATVLRSFPSHEPFNVWFKSPVFELDTEDLLKNAVAVGSTQKGYAAGAQAAKSQAARDLEEEHLRMERCFNELESVKGEVTLSMLRDAYNADRVKNDMTELSRQTIDNKFYKHPHLESIKKGAGRNGSPIVRRKKTFDDLLEHEDFPDGI